MQASFKRYSNFIVLKITRWQNINSFFVLLFFFKFTFLSMVSLFLHWFFYWFSLNIWILGLCLCFHFFLKARIFFTKFNFTEFNFSPFVSSRKSSRKNTFKSADDSQCAYSHSVLWISMRNIPFQFQKLTVSQWLNLFSPESRLWCITAGGALCAGDWNYVVVPR